MKNEYYQKTLIYLYLQKLKCPNCNRVLGSKAITKKNGKPYFYYYCHDCKIEFRENLINEYFNQFIDELVQYDSVVNQFSKTEVIENRTRKSKIFNRYDK